MKKILLALILSTCAHASASGVNGLKSIKDIESLNLRFHKNFKFTPFEDTNRSGEIIPTNKYKNPLGSCDLILREDRIAPTFSVDHMINRGTNYNSTHVSTEENTLLIYASSWQFGKIALLCKFQDLENTSIDELQTVIGDDILMRYVEVKENTNTSSAQN